MEKYIIKKILSNNVVLVQKNEAKYILVGKGIGFGKKRDSILENTDVIEESFVSMEVLNEAEYHDLLNTLDPEILELCNEIVDMAKEELKEELDFKVILTLIDHINFAIKRLKEDIEIVNPFLYEIKILYPKEYKIASKAVELLKYNLKIDIPDDEIGFIALHIYGSRKNRTKTEALENTKLINEIVNFTKKKLYIDIDLDSFNHNRFIMHLRGVIDRIKNNEIIENVLISEIRNQFPIEFNVALQIASILSKNLGVAVPDSEIGFMTLHLFKLNKIK